MVSVIIPTYNRKLSVLRTLESLTQQSLNVGSYEVIVVDDGSPDDTAEIAKLSFPFRYQYIRQENQGATSARNNGVRHSQGQVLIFIDDDVTVSPSTLKTLADKCMETEQHLIMGTLIHRNPNGVSPETQKQLQNANLIETHSQNDITSEEMYISFEFCNTELLAVKREDFFTIGMLQDPTDGRGWPNWDDVDFGYRAHLKGFKLLQCKKAVGEHWDYSLASFDIACHRWQRAAKSAVCLFQTHPGLQPHIPMLLDKTPVNWQQDNLKLITRKFVRHLMSAKPVMEGLEQLIKVLRKIFPSSPFLPTLYRWVAGGYMFRGYQEGLREFGHVNNPS